jgi:hypothetical protein
LTQFDKSANMLLGGDWWCHNPNSTKGQFYSRARQPTILSKLEIFVREGTSGNRQDFSTFSRYLAWNDLSAVRVVACPVLTVLCPLDSPMMRVTAAGGKGSPSSQAEPGVVVCWCAKRMVADNELIQIIGHHITTYHDG